MIGVNIKSLLILRRFLRCILEFFINFNVLKIYLIKEERFKFFNYLFYLSLLVIV